MIDTHMEADGVGLAAVQVGVLKRIIIIDVDTEDEEAAPIVMINPVIKETDGEQEGYEGCLSVPGKTGIVKRPQRVVVEFQDENLESVTMEGEGIFARCVCHECDHLDGEMYVHRVIGVLKDVDSVEEE
jgi:peptide deformylase